MKQENIARDYNIFTGKPTKPTTHYGEIHTDDAWEPSRYYFCGNHPQFMPIALLIFGDESHYDNHGSLKTLPLCFTLSRFNETARNSVNFWRPIAFLPTLGHGRSSGDNTPVDLCLQDLHDCLSVGLQSLVKLTERGGIATTVLKTVVICKVWIHYIIGDCNGNNEFLGHNKGYNGQCKHPYCDCKCSGEDLSNPNPQCEYITPDYILEAKVASTKAT